MNFYIDPAFYVFLAIIPAAVLGFTGHRIKYYGLAASTVFLLLLFGEDWQGMAAFAAFLLIACAATFWELASWKRGEKALWKYRTALVLVIAPLIIYKIAAVFDGNLMGFLGISYITFKAVQVVIEVRDGIIEDMDFIDYLYFLVFFTPFTSGPIDRSRRFAEDARKVRSRDESIPAASTPTCWPAASCSSWWAPSTKKCWARCSTTISRPRPSATAHGGASSPIR